MMTTMNKLCLMMALLSGCRMSFALPTVHFDKTVGVGGGNVGGSSGDVAVSFGGASASGFATGHSSGAGAGAGAGAITVEKEITYGHKTIPQRTEIVAEKTFTEAPKVISEHTIQGQAQVQRTVIEKTVIPQYVEKTIQVPSYVEKTIRVPTVVEHKVRVPVTPKIVEKTYEENAAAGAHVHAGASVGGKVQLQERPQVYSQKQFGIRTNAAMSASSGAYGGGGAATHTGGNGVQVTYKSNGDGGAGGGLFGNILNIPVATLGAVGNLLNSFTNAGAAVSVNKNYY